MTEVARLRAADIDWNGIRQRLDSMAGQLDRTFGLSPEQAKRILDERARIIGPALAFADHAAARIEVLTLSLVGERYAIETLYAREVGPPTAVTPIPGTPDFIRGVANLRGEIITIIDLGRFFGMAPQGDTDRSRIIVLGTNRPELAFIADDVFEVVSLPSEGLANLDTTTTHIDRAYLRAVTNDALIILDGAALINEQRLMIHHESGSPLTSPDGRTR